MPTIPTPDESLDRLRHAGWTVQETSTAASWTVRATHGSYHIWVTAATREEALQRVCRTAADLKILTTEKGS